MSTKTSLEAATIEQLTKELEEANSSQAGSSKDLKLKEITKAFAHKKDWSHALSAFQFITNEKERNLLIADLIEDFLLPEGNINQAKSFAKYLTPTPEIQPLVLIRIALTENKGKEAEEIAAKIPSALARNYAYSHILESYFENKQTNQINEIKTLILENARTIYDLKSRSAILREIALNLFLANHDKKLAKEAASLIPNELIRNVVLTKIDSHK